MKNFKFLYLLLAVVGVVTFAACTNIEEWTPGTPDKNAGVYFLNTSVVNVTAESTEAAIVVKRSSGDQELTVSVRSEIAEDAVDFLSIPSSVTFEAGKDEATLVVAISNAANMVEGKKYIAKIQLDSAEASNYGASEVDFVFMIPEKWVDYKDENGKLIYGTYVDDFFPAFMEYDPGYAVPIQIQKHETDPNRYRVLEPFGKNFCNNMFGAVPGYFQLTEGAYIEFNVADPANVVVVNNPVDTGVQINFTGIGLQPITMIVSEEPGSLTFKDGVFSFAAQAVTLDAAAAGSTPVNASGLMAYVLPGAVITDYDLTVQYAGMFVDANNTSANAVLEFTAGTDVETIKYTIVSGDVSDDYAAVVETVVAGTADPLYVITEAEELTQEVALTRGSWTVVAVPFGADGAQADDAIAYPFWFNGTGEVPVAEVSVRFGSMLELTGEEHEEFSSDYWAGIGIEANGSEVKSIKAFVSTLLSVEGSGLSYETILANYGNDFSSEIQELKDNEGSAIVGPFNVPIDTEVIALVAVETIYGETKFFDLTCKTTNSTGIQFGEYKVTEGDYSTVVGLYGGYKAGEAFVVIDELFELSGSYDLESKTITTDGYETYYVEGDIIINDIMFYTDSQTKTHTYGYWVGKDADFAEATDLTFAYGEDGVVNALSCYFEKRIYKMGGEQPEFESCEYAFTPAATVVKNVAQAEPTKAGVLASAKSASSNAKLVGVTVNAGGRIWIPAM